MYNGNNEEVTAVLFISEQTRDIIRYVDQNPKWVNIKNDFREKTVLYGCSYPPGDPNEGSQVDGGCLFHVHAN